jgi:hypothetical protein
MRARASEFPNDNRALHRGAVWVTSEPCGAWTHETLMTPGPPATEATPAKETTLATETMPVATATLEAPAEPVVQAEAVEEETAEDIEIVEELEPLDLELGTHADDDPFATFIQTLVEVASDAGCERAAAILPALLDEGRVMPGVLPTSVTDALLASGMLALTDSGLVGGEAFRKTAAAWRAILRGDSEDFSSCGPRMLDEWAADLVACLVAAPAKTERLRRELRTRGVAAFGLVLAA